MSMATSSRAALARDAHTARMREVARELAPILRLIREEKWVMASVELDHLATMDRRARMTWDSDSLQSHLRSVLIDRYSFQEMAQIYKRIRAGAVMVDVELGKITARQRAEAQIKAGR